jgi:lipopolysaccharide/colanic/teichoic acid biosynthesis glycosyltransferase
MCVNAEGAGAPQWAQQNDSRVTGVGRVIRLLRIDELPQIFNVLRGDMSFVGPRPERPYFVKELSSHIPFYANRHSVKPGITGWAQINYPYGASVKDAREKLQYDLYYAKNHSLFLDLIILVQTVQVILFGKGAR